MHSIKNTKHSLKTQRHKASRNKRILKDRWRFLKMILVHHLDHVWLLRLWCCEIQNFTQGLLKQTNKLICILKSQTSSKVSNVKKNTFYSNKKHLICKICVHGHEFSILNLCELSEMYNLCPCSLDKAIKCCQYLKEWSLVKVQSGRPRSKQFPDSFSSVSNHNLPRFPLANHL